MKTRMIRRCSFVSYAVKLKYGKILKSIWLDIQNLVFSIHDIIEKAGLLFLWVYCIGEIFNSIAKAVR
jgi:hypothetical protein